LLAVPGNKLLSIVWYYAVVWILGLVNITRQINKHTAVVIIRGMFDMLLAKYVSYFQSSGF